VQIDCVTEKEYTISVMKMEYPRYAEAIRLRVKHAKPGAVYVMADFADLAPNNAANRVVSRMVDDGELIGILRGVYQKPKFSRLLKENALPEVDEVAQALARKSGWTICPDGDTALNLLGLSTQVPAAWNYLSDGPYKKYSYSGGLIVFKHSANRLLGNLSLRTALVVQALRALGSEHVDAKTISRLSERFDSSTWKLLGREVRMCPDWIRQIVDHVLEVRHD